MLKFIRRAAALIFAGVCIAAVALFLAGTYASLPAPAAIGPAPENLPVESISIASGSGARLSGWFVRGRPGGGAVMLMHGIRANRLEMLGRARFLHAQGFSVLLFDFQASGESSGDRITFGYREAADARAAFDILRKKAPGERTGVIGLSLGGASAVLADPPLEADAMVLEAVYSDFVTAVKNRLAMRCSRFCAVFAPLLTWQVKPRLGFDPAALAPAAHISRIHAPLLLVAGERDEHATPEDVKQIYSAANQPKTMWIVPGAAHVDFHRAAPEEYERRVLGFLSSALRG
jgi:fermentation-respiration switch protein FrsA (DUF1100 family)